MKIALIAISNESYSLEILSSFLKQQGHQPKIYFFPNLFSSEVISNSTLFNMFDTSDQLVNQIIADSPQLIGFSVFTINYQTALNIARKIKRKNKKIPIIFGGIHPTSVPEIVIKQKCVDMVCVGEGEYPLLQLADSLEKQKPDTAIKNIWFKTNQRKIIKNALRPLITNLDHLPFPDKNSFYNIYPGFITDYYTTTSRGCPYGCTFCANNVLNRLQRNLGPTIRRRSPQNVIEELVWAKKNFPIKRITFVDDIFVQDQEWLKIFTQLYHKNVNLPYIVLTHPSLIDSTKAELLKQSGCYFLLFGIQSASATIRVNILRRNETNDQISQAAQACHHANLKFSIDHILNIPTETIYDYVFALDFYHQLKPTIVNCFYLQFFPKTEIISKAKLPASTIKKINHGLSSSSVVVGLGGKDTIDPMLTQNQFQFLFLILPIIPTWLKDLIINKKLYQVKFHPPLILNIIIKLILSIRAKRLSVYTGIIKQNIHFIIQNISLKYAK